MFKKFIVTITLVFLLFEVLYYHSNLKSIEMKESDDALQVYEFSLSNKRDDFLINYSDIVLESNDEKIVILTSSQEFNNIKEKYNIK